MWLDEAIPPDVNAHRLRHYRLNRVRQEMTRLDYGACVLVDLVNIRYATDTRNMQIFTARNPARYLFLPLEGPVILFEFDRCEHLPAGIDTIDGVLEANMTLCVESYVGEYGDADAGLEGVKLEQQVLITENGYELLSYFPFEDDLLGHEVYGTNQKD